MADEPTYEVHRYTHRCRLHGTLLRRDAGDQCGPCMSAVIGHWLPLPRPVEQRMYSARLTFGGLTVRTDVEAPDVATVDMGRDGKAPPTDPRDTEPSGG